jgi:hypothetical protein
LKNFAENNLTFASKIGRGYIYVSWLRVALGLFVAEPPDFLVKLAKNFEYLSTSSCSKAATAVVEDVTGVFGSLSVNLLASRSWSKSVIRIN